jgi:hypothetical protein
MLTIHPDFREFLTALNSNGVQYLILGGYAVNFHGHHRNTKDLDVWIAVNPANAERLSQALIAFGFSPDAVPPAAFSDKDKIFAFGKEPTRIDILLNPTEIDFDACFSRRVVADIGGLDVPFISLPDLRHNKRASGRLKDRADLGSLPELPE